MIGRLGRQLLLPAVLASPVVLFAQLQQIGGIGGQVRVSGGDFLPHQIMVELQLRQATINSVYTDAQGRFDFISLEANPYHVIINEEGYYPVNERVDLRPDAPYVNLQIFLRPREQPKKDDPLGVRALGGNPYLVDQGDYNKRFPKKAVKEYERGLDAEHKGKPDQAIAHYVGALKIAPDYYPAHNNLGALYLGKSDFKSAEEQFQDAILLDQNEAQAYFNLANVLMLTGRYQESESALSSGMQKRPDSAFAHFLQGCLYGRSNRVPQAEASLRKALELDPAMWQAQLQIANLYLQHNQRGDAIRELESFLKTFPATPAAPKARETLQKLSGNAASSVGPPK